MEDTIESLKAEIREIKRRLSRIEQNKGLTDAASAFARYGPTMPLMDIEKDRKETEAFIEKVKKTRILCSKCNEDVSLKFYMLNKDGTKWCLGCWYVSNQT